MTDYSTHHHKHPDSETLDSGHLGPFFDRISAESEPANPATDPATRPGPPSSRTPRPAPRTPRTGPTIRPGPTDHSDDQDPDPPGAAALAEVAV